MGFLLSKRIRVLMHVREDRYDASCQRIWTVFLMNRVGTVLLEGL
jgi:hypothetical protein